MQSTDADEKCKTAAYTAACASLGLDARRDGVFTEAAIRKAYKVRALACHPDRQRSEDAKRAAHKQFTDLFVAYELLLDSDFRALGAGNNKHGLEQPLTTEKTWTADVRRVDFDHARRTQLYNDLVRKETQAQAHADAEECEQRMRERLRRELEVLSRELTEQLDVSVIPVHNDAVVVKTEQEKDEARFAHILKLRRNAHVSPDVALSAAQLQDWIYSVFHVPSDVVVGFKGDTVLVRFTNAASCKRVASATTLLAQKHLAVASLKTRKRKDTVKEDSTSRGGQAHVNSEPGFGRTQHFNFGTELDAYEHETMNRIQRRKLADGESHR
ncbi:hypothetical protein FVE85_9076 [Porphyridium purpureum]|uniref:J domain-containing protein n=1 Tax=Porphyridium purpureum TaxID=35688 RepID=A0A5J4YQ20_PORPP|nr:hypothetical protein FVE85_9076 [Porphyridium purpureum]|eukprot:POR7750..scf222_8